MKPTGFVIIFIIIFCVGFSAYIIISDNPGEKDTPITDPDGEEHGFYSQRLIMNYQDGTTSNDLISGWMYHDDKIIESVTYCLFATPDDSVDVIINSYSFQYTITRNNEHVKSGMIMFNELYQGQVTSRTKLVEKTIDPFDFINYTYPDGTYLVTISPSGSIQVNDESVNLPDTFRFTVDMIDERSVDIGFK